MIPILAQASFDTIPATWLKWGLISFVALVVFLCIVAGVIIAALQLSHARRAAREPQRREITPQPVAVEAKVSTRRDYKKQLEETRHEEVARRLDGHDEEIDTIWHTMRGEDAKLAAELNASRSANAARFESVSVSLARIETKLGTLPPPQA